VPQSEREDPQIEPQRPLVDVVEVVLYPLRKGVVAAQIVYLRLTRDARLREALLHVAPNRLQELFDETGPARPRTRE